MATPPPPPGFKLVDAVPPPPPGFKLANEQPSMVDSAQSMAGDVFSALLRHDKGFDYSGVPSAKFRAALSRADNDEERKAFLDKSVGEDGYTNDAFGRLALTPTGMTKLGLKSKSGKPVVVDEGTFSRYDLADMAGSAPSIIGAMAAGSAATGVGLPAGIALAGLGAAGGKGYGEAIEAMMGENRQSAGEVAGDLAVEGGAAALGEGVFRGILAPIGRKLLAPEAKRITQAGLDITDEARQIGARPSVSQITKAPILGRVQNMMHRVVGDPAAKQNQAALHQEMVRLANDAGPKIGRIDVGEAAVRDISRARKALARWSGIAYGKVDDMAGGQPIVPVGRLKTTAGEILDALPKNVDGTPVLTDASTLASLKQIAELPDSVTITQMQAIRGRLHDAVSDNTLVPGLSSRYARTLRDAASRSMDDIPDANVTALLKQVNAVYAKNIKKFDDSLVQRITRDPRNAGAIPPDMLIESVFRKNQASALGRVMPLLKNNTKAQIRRQAMDKILDTVIPTTDDPLVSIFNGKALQDTLDSYGKETLDAMFGRQLSDDLYRFSRVTRFVTQKQAMSGGLVAAGVALHPWRNFGRILQMNLMSRFMNTDAGIRWLTVGLKAPKTRAGAAAIARASSLAAALADDEAKQAPRSEFGVGVGQTEAAE